MSFLHKPQSHFDDLLSVHDHDQLLCLLEWHIHSRAFYLCTN